MHRPLTNLVLVAFMTKSLALLADAFHYVRPYPLGLIHDIAG